MDVSVCAQKKLRVSYSDQHSSVSHVGVLVMFCQGVSAFGNETKSVPTVLLATADGVLVLPLQKESYVVNITWVDE